MAHRLLDCVACTLPSVIARIECREFARGCGRRKVGPVLRDLDERCKDRGPAAAGHHARSVYHAAPTRAHVFGAQCKLWDFQRHHARSVATLSPAASAEPNVRAREGRLRVQGRRPALQDGGRCGAGAAPVRHLPRADAAVPRRTEPPREAAPRASNPKPCADHCRRSTERPTILARCRPGRWCQEDIKAWRKCFEEQRALDGRPVDSSDSPLQKARQKLDPTKYDKQGRPLK